MVGNSKNQYLESKVLTASQPRLHLMLLEGAVRQCRVAQQAGLAEYWGEFYAGIDKAMDIVEELSRSVHSQKNEISEKLEEQYAFLYRELAACRFSLDQEKLTSCMKLLDFERETWKLACDKLEVAPLNQPRSIVPHISMSTGPVESFSFEA